MDIKKVKQADQILNLLDELLENSPKPIYNSGPGPNPSPSPNFKLDPIQFQPDPNSEITEDEPLVQYQDRKNVELTDVDSIGLIEKNTNIIESYGSDKSPERPPKKRSERPDGRSRRSRSPPLNKRPDRRSRSPPFDKRPINLSHFWDEPGSKNLRLQKRVIHNPKNPHRCTESLFPTQRTLNINDDDRTRLRQMAESFSSKVVDSIKNSEPKVELMIKSIDWIVFVIDVLNKYLMDIYVYLNEKIWSDEHNIADVIKDQLNLLMDYIIEKISKRIAEKK